MFTLSRVRVYTETSQQSFHIPVTGSNIFVLPNSCCHPKHDERWSLLTSTFLSDLLTHLSLTHMKITNTCITVDAFSSVATSPDYFIRPTDIAVSWLGRQSLFQSISFSSIAYSRSFEYYFATVETPIFCALNYSTIGKSKNSMSSYSTNIHAWNNGSLWRKTEAENGRGSDLLHVLCQCWNKGKYWKMIINYAPFQLNKCKKISLTCIAKLF